MIKFLRNLRDLYKVVKEIKKTGIKVYRLAGNVNETFDKSLLEFEEKIKQMTFNYSSNLDDAKSDYLKKYLEIRINCLGNECNALESRLRDIESNIKKLDEWVVDGVTRFRAYKKLTRERILNMQRANDKNNKQLKSEPTKKAD